MLKPIFHVVMSGGEKIFLNRTDLNCFVDKLPSGSFLRIGPVCF